MTSEIKVHVPRQGVQAYFGKQQFNQFLVVTAIMLAALFLGACTTALPESQAPTQDKELSVQRAFKAETARYEAMADFYTTEKNVQRALEAETARYEAMADFYTTEKVQRALEAETARYEAMAAFYMTKSEVSPSTVLAANPELAVVHRHIAKVEWHRDHFPGR